MSVTRRSPTESNTATVILVFAVIAALYFTREILIPLAFALVLTFLLTPAVAFLEKLRMGRVVPAILTVAVSMAAAGWITWILANQVVEVASQLPTYRQNIHAKIEALRIAERVH
jgi:predicted PurR-regulated permease PerM